MKQKILTMLDMQDAMNQKVSATWRENNYEWYRAIWVECAELMDHYGWKWWKKQTPDTDQVILELIDIWHFGLSMLLTESSDNGLTAETIEKTMRATQASPQTDFRLILEEFTGSVLQEKRFDVARFTQLMHAVGLNFDALYKSYVGKNVLNFFRQDNGYKEGTYLKVWRGREDNEHLVEVVDSLNSDAPTFRDDVYAALSERYDAAR